MEPKGAGTPRRSIFKKEVPERRRAALTALLSLLTGLGLSLDSYLIGTQSVRRAVASLWTAPLATWATALLLGLLALALAFLSRSLFAAGLIVSVPLLTASFVNYFKLTITLSPLLVSDLTLLGKLREITRLNSASLTLSRNSALAILAAALWLVALFALSRPLRLPWKRSLIGAWAAALVFALLFCAPPVVDGWIYAPLRAAGYGREGQKVAAGPNDVVLNLWSGLVRSRKSTLADPDSPEGRALIADIRGFVDAVEPGGDDTRPNVIFILAESFFDLTTLPGVEYEGDPMAEFHRVQDAGVSGKFHTRTLGYGTSAIEMELLTGINTRYFEYERQLSEWAPDEFERLSAVPRLMRDKGYYTAFVHTFNDSVYERARTYSHLGFDDLYFSGDFAEFLPEAAAAEDYWAYMNSRISGEFYGDDLFADGIIGLYEREKERGESPVFLYGVTMENHSPFTADRYDTYEFPFTADLDGEAAGVLNSVTQSSANCARALGKLADYFARADEPTVIVFYGDHRPGLQLDGGGSLYAALGMVPENFADWSLEQIAALLSTDYVIWANDESLLPAPAGTRGRDSSSNFLGLDVLRLAGVELDDWWRMLASVREDVIIWTWDYFLAADGTLAALPGDCLDAEGRRKTEAMTWLMRQTFAVDGDNLTIYNLLE